MKLSLICLLLFILLFVSLPTPLYAAGLKTSAPWPAVGNNMKRDGRTSIIGPSKPRIRTGNEWGKDAWFSRNFAQLRGFTVDTDKLYAVAGQGGMAAFDKVTGKRLWEFVVRDSNNANPGTSCGDALEPWINYAPTIADDGRLYITSEWGFLTAHTSSDGKAIWFADIGKSEISPAIDENTVYAMGWNDNVYAYNTNHQLTGNVSHTALKWKYKLNQGFTYGAPALGSDGKLYYAFDGLQVFHTAAQCPLPTTQYICGQSAAVYCPAQRIWSILLPHLDHGHGEQYGFYGPAIDEVRRAAYWTQSGAFHAIDIDTRQAKWPHIDTGSDTRGRIPAINRDGTIYFGADTGLYVVDHRDGSRILKAIGRVEGPVIVDGNNNVYAYTTQGSTHYLHSLSPTVTNGEPDLVERPNYPIGVGTNNIGGFSDHQIAMDSDGTVYVPAGLNKIVAIEQDGPPITTGPTNTPTPTRIPGDVNNDKRVSITDYNQIISLVGGSGSNADFNTNGRVDIFDYNLVIRNFQ